MPRPKAGRDTSIPEIFGTCSHIPFDLDRPLEPYSPGMEIVPDPSKTRLSPRVTIPSLGDLSQTVREQVPKMMGMLVSRHPLGRGMADP